MISQRQLEAGALFAMPIAVVALGWHIGHSITGSAAMTALAFAIPAGYILADLVSGLAHWLADRFGSADTPVFGKMFIQPFREHHADPTGITHHDLIEIAGATCTLLVPLLAIWTWLVPAPGGNWMLAMVHGGMLTFTTGILGTNLFHKWAHMDPGITPAGVRWLQRRRLILSHDHHAIHHVSPFDTYYCITTGWMNPLLARTGILDRIERVLGRAPGV